MALLKNLSWRRQIELSMWKPRSLSKQQACLRKKEKKRTAALIAGNEDGESVVKSIGGVN
jgi:hypothetical protein